MQTYAKNKKFKIQKNENKRVKNCIEEKKAAAVVPKMLLYSLPRCINSIGNYIPPWKWGSDNFMGHFDFGQFDNLTEVPSACFGAVMLKRKALEDIGPIDNRYQAYYEDADWSYRVNKWGQAPFCTFCKKEDILTQKMGTRPIYLCPLSLSHGFFTIQPSPS